MAEQGLHEYGGVSMEEAKKLNSRRGHSCKTAKGTKEDQRSLPTPPPDPWRVQEVLRETREPGTEEVDEEMGVGTTEEEEDIIAYLSNLGQQFPACTPECANPDETFGHLDRLYSLAEQVLLLRERGSKLFRRVRDLERKRVLKAADLEAERAIIAGEYPASELPDEDAGFAESLLDAILANGREPQTPRRTLRSPSSRRRSRSLGFPEQTLTPRVVVNNRIADLDKLQTRNNTGSPKVSKWTKVKAAFKWERACTNDLMEVMETTPSTPTTKYLRIPEVTGSWSGSTLSPATSEVSGPSTSVGRVSSASSSNEDVFDGQRRSAPERVEDATKRNIEVEIPITVKSDPIENTTNEQANQEKLTTLAPPSPGKLSPKLPVVSGGERSRESPEQPCKRATPILTITIPPNDEEFRNASSPESISPLPSSLLDSGDSSPQRTKAHRETGGEFKRQRSIAEETAAPRPKMQRQDSKWNKVRRAFLTNTAFSVPPSPVRVTPRLSFQHDDSTVSKIRSCGGSVEDLTRNIGNSQADTRRDYRLLREKLGAEFHRKLVEWERLKSSGRPMGTEAALLPGEERLAPEFRRKLQEWKRTKKGRRGSDSIEQQQQQQQQHRASRRRLTDWQLWRSTSKPEGTSSSAPRGSCASVTSTGSAPGDGKPHPCEDFVRRMEAWRRINSTSTPQVNSSIDDTEFLALDRLLPVLAAPYGKRHPGMGRLDPSYIEKSADLGNEILVQTSVGSYRFEGISREFTRKLYDWEKYRGISPRSSTFRLLGPTYAALAGECNNEASTTSPSVMAEEEAMLDGPKRCKSMSSIDSNLRDLTPLRRSTSLQSLTRMANQLSEDNRASTSSAPIDVQRIEDATTEDSEPEAMIVDIEDVIEETASPLTRVQPQQMPVYSVAASETTSIAVPLGTVTSSHEPSPVILMEAEDKIQRSWNPETDCSSQDEDSLVSERSTSSIGWNKFPRDMEDIRCADEKVVAISSGAVDDNEESDAERSDEERGIFESAQDLTELVKFSTKVNANMDKSTDLPSESSDERRREEEGNYRQGIYLKADTNDKRDEKRKLDRIKVKFFQFGEGCPSQIRQEEIPRLQQIADVQRNESFKNLRDLKLDVDRPDITCTRYVKEEDINAKFYENYRKSREDSVRSRWFNDFLSSVPRTDSTEIEKNFNLVNEKISPDISKLRSNKTELKTERIHQPPSFQGERSLKVQSGFESFSTAGSTMNMIQFHGEPIIKTTPLTVTTYPESRKLKKIIINEKTLNKIVVPTANPETSRSVQNEVSTVEKEPEDVIDKEPEEVCITGRVENSTEDQSDSRGSAATGSSCNSNSSGNGSNPAATGKKQKQKSESPNVFVKTKRMIFSPFRRAEDSQARKNSSSSEEKQAKRSSKSRSASPKVSKQDAFHRMQLPLLWPLGISLKNQEVPEEIVERPSSRQDFPSARNEPSADETDTSSQLACQEPPEVAQKHKRVSIIAPNAQENPSVPSERAGKEKSGKDESDSSDRLSSDLMHKLRILSNVVARREGRERVDDTDLNTETVRSARIRRAKEGFLSRRTVCHSVVESRTCERPSEEGSGRIGSSGTAGPSYGISTSRPDLIKSASVGMINLEPDAFGRFNSSHRGCESLPRTISKRRDSSGPLAKIAGKLGLARFIRGKDTEEAPMSAVSTLCRQSLLIGMSEFGNPHQEDSQSELRESQNEVEAEVEETAAKTEADRRDPRENEDSLDNQEVN